MRCSWLEENISIFSFSIRIVPHRRWYWQSAPSKTCS